MALTEKEREAVAWLCAALRSRFGDHLCGCFLFGSKARGQEAAGSDVDLLVVLDEAADVDDTGWRVVSHLAYEALERFGVYLETVVLSRSQYERPKGADRLFVASVKEEGVAL